MCLHATSSRIFDYQNQPVVQKARKMFSFSHVNVKQDQECRGKVCRNTKGSASCFSHVKAEQRLFFSRQSKARPRQAVIAKWQTKQWVQERENQCKAEIKETSSAQCPVGLKGRRPHAPRDPTVPLHQHYRHSHPQCEGGMPGSFQLREDMGPDRLQAVEDWLRVEGFAFRFRQKRWRV